MMTINLKDKKEVVSFLQNPTVAMAESITGLLVSEKDGYKLIAGRIIQGALKANLITQLGRELKDLRDKGKIKEDYFATHNQQATLVDLLKFIDTETPDEEVFNAMKSIFFKTVSKNTKANDELLGYQLLQVAKKLNSGEIVTLKTVYKIYQKNKLSLERRSAKEWLKEVGNKAGLPPEAIELYETNLIKLKLISDRVHQDRSGINTSQSYRLTEFGLMLCEYIIAFK